MAQVFDSLGRAHAAELSPRHAPGAAEEQAPVDRALEPVPITCTCQLLSLCCTPPLHQLHPVADVRVDGERVCTDCSAVLGTTAGAPVRVDRERVAASVCGRQVLVGPGKNPRSPMSRQE